MRKSAIQILALACAAALVMAPVISPGIAKAGSKTSKSAHLRKHPRTISHRSFAPAFQGQPIVGPAGPAGDVCPGNARSFDCKIWPPPFDDDPDRKNSGTDGG
jgi:hypothetical protein